MTDTTHQAEEVRMRALRAMTMARRFSMALGWSQSVRDLSKASLQRQFPGCSPSELRRMMAERTLGPDLASKAYGTL